MNITEFCESIRGWLNVGSDVYPDSVVTSWVRFTDEWMSEKLRCKHMIAIDDAALTSKRVRLPDDWEELDTVRINDEAALIYAPRDEFYDSELDTRGRYTIVGNYILIDREITDPPSNVEISYYESIPPPGNSDTWVTLHYLSLYTIKTLHYAAMYAIDDERE